jgi:ribonuclease BN (tRNA processing enzyme)
MRVVPLGVNGFFPGSGRHTATYLALTDEAAYMMDAGTGVSRLLEPEIAEMLKPYDHLNVFLSHYHLDHCIGLAYLMGVWDRDVRVYGPATPHNISNPEEALGKLLTAPYSAPLDFHPFEVKLIPVSEESLTVDGFEMRFRTQKHWCKSMGIRLGDEIAYITDTVPDDGTTDLVRGVKLLLHEVWMTDDELETDEIGRREHSNASAVARIGMEADVGRIMMIHHRPERTTEEIEEMRQSMEKAAGRKVIAPIETRVYEV